MTNYKKYTAFDFLKDPFFVEWAKRPTVESEDFWSNWLERNPEKRRTVQNARSILQNLHYDKHEVFHQESNEVLEKILNRINKDSLHLEKGKEQKQTWRWLRLAAIIVLTIGMGIVAWRYLEKPNVQQVTSLEKPQFIIKENRAGVRSTLKLPDGTVVYLNASSKLKVPETFASGQRHVFLKGEAFFEVVEDTSRPFKVISGELATTALGTSFNVAAYPDDVSIKVALVTGKVRVDNIVNNKPTKVKLSSVLLPTEMLSLKKSSGNIEKKSFDYEQIIAWKDGILVFEDANFLDVISRLERWYGVEFILQNNPKLSRGFSGRFDNQSLEKVLKVLSFSSGFNYTINSKQVFIY